MAEKKTTWQLLRNKYPAGECVLLQEVSDTTGGRNRSADFIVVNLWPSRGNSIIGFEVKSWRNDWLKELKRPEKQEAIYKYCDYFYLLTDRPNVAKIEEVPVNWGWMHIENDRLKTMKEAPKLNATTCSRQFMCSLLRRADSKQGFIHKDEIEDRINEAKEIAVKQASNENSWKADGYDRLQDIIKEFETASGIKINQNWPHNTKQIGEALALVLDGEIPRLEKRLKQFQKEFLEVHNTIQPLFNKLQLCQKNNNQTTGG